MVRNAPLAHVRQLVEVVFKLMEVAGEWQYGLLCQLCNASCRVDKRLYAIVAGEACESNHPSTPPWSCSVSFPLSKGGVTCPPAIKKGHVSSLLFKGGDRGTLKGRCGNLPHLSSDWRGVWENSVVGGNPPSTPLGVSRPCSNNTEVEAGSRVGAAAVNE